MVSNKIFVSLILLGLVSACLPFENESDGKSCKEIPTVNWATHSDAGLLANVFNLLAMLLGGHNDSGEPGHHDQDSPTHYPPVLGDGSDNRFNDQVTYEPGHEEPWNDDQVAEEQVDGFEYWIYNRYNFLKRQLKNLSLSFDLK